ncbi:MAG: hypothetical protein RR495_06575 [Anaerovoracaceae bacterium]
MYFTLSLRDLGIVALILVAIIALVYVILLLKNLVVTVKKSNKILGNVETMASIAEKRSKELDSMLDGVSGSVKEITDAIKGQQSLIKQLSQISSALASIVGIFKPKKDDKEAK